MKSHIDNIGVIDKDGKVHNVKLHLGLNIITGRSSTGKSALISIFDYCTGKKQNTIPRGVISEKASIYFIVLKMDTGALVLGRKHSQPSKAFIKPESDVPDEAQITEEYFSEDYFIPIKSFIEQLGQFWGLSLTDTDESKLYGSSKGRPSVRNMISFMLQPQNLIANNQGLFYRFDDSEHKEKVISEFKIFMGLVDQRYYLAHQELEAARKQKRDLITKLTYIKEQIGYSAETLDEYRDNYEAITGLNLFGDEKSISIVETPQLHIDKLKIEDVKVDEESEAYKMQYEELQAKKNKLLGDRHALEIKRSDIKSSINVIKKYADQIDGLKPTSEAYKIHHDCPFCHSESTSTQSAANALSEAILWLNRELKEAPSLWKTYLPQLNEIDSQISALTKQIGRVNEQIAHVREIGENLKKNNSLEQQANTLKVQVSYLLSAVKRLDITGYQTSIETLDQLIQNLEAELAEKYDIDGKIKGIESFIDKTMNDLAKGFSFEKEYTPVKLHFDTHKFELYCQLKGEKVYLSSMGSAANWLYSHLCLFLSLTKLFSKESEKCTIPPILFIDQPSQVYFPTMTRDDIEDKFNADNLSKQANDDLTEVSNMFIRILDFIQDVEKEYGFAPQIILTEHADELNLGKYHFDKYVVKRWRGKNDGLISVEFDEENPESANNINQVS